MKIQDLVGRFVIVDCEVKGHREARDGHVTRVFQKATDPALPERKEWWVEIAIHLGTATPNALVQMAASDKRWGVKFPQRPACSSGADPLVPEGADREGSGGRHERVRLALGRASSVAHAASIVGMSSTGLTSYCQHSAVLLTAYRELRKRSRDAARTRGARSPGARAAVEVSGVRKLNGGS